MSVRNYKYDVKSCTIITCIILSLGAVAFFAFRSCKNEDYDFRTQNEAIEFYRSYLHSIMAIKTTDGKTLCDEINHWQEISDTVYNYINGDSVAKVHDKRLYEYQNIRDSIRFEFIHLTETWKCSYEDVILIKEGTTPFRNDQEIIDAVHNATPFFVKLDEAKITQTTKFEALEQYRQFLSVVERKGVHTKEEMLTFISGEDIMFRQFLKHLWELDNDHVADITHSTERICSGIFKEARAGKIDPKDALTYMSMRTVRRLLQNSLTCVNDIGTRRMHSKMQANAYLWMIIQPFTNIDAFAISTMTAESKEDFYTIAKKLPKSNTFAKTFDIDPEALSYLLPQQLLKMYILSL